MRNGAKCEVIRKAVADGVRLVALAAMLAGAAGAHAAADYPPAIAGAVANGVKVVSSFPAASGLTGWVLSQQGHYSVVYTTADRKTLVVGTLIGEHGENLSTRYAQQHVPRPDPAALFQRLEKSAYVTEGATSKPKGMVYVFFDANCPYCHYTWKALQPYEKAGLQVRWIPVGILGPTSMPKAIEMLAASDRLAAFRKLEQSHGKSWTPSAGASETAQPAIAKSIRDNGELMESFGINGTPGIVWKDSHGKVAVKSGMPFLSELPAITGLPEQKIDDPELERFR